MAERLRRHRAPVGHGQRRHPQLPDDPGHRAYKLRSRPTTGYGRYLKTPRGAPRRAEHLPPEARGRITLLGELPAGALARLRQRAAVTVVTSRFETFSMTALEAMAHGSPLVATRVGGIPEVATDGETALLVPAGDAAALAAAITRLLDDRELAARLGAQAAAVAETRFASDRLALQARAFYDDVCARWPARGA